MATLLFFIIFTAFDSAATSGYILHSEQMTWFEAQNYCREHHLDLATIVDSDQNDLMTTFRTDGFAWIGLFDDATKWMWSIGNTDLNSTGFTNWAPSNPDYYSIYPSQRLICVSMEDGGLWNDRHCGEQLPSICYEDPNNYKRVNTPLSWESSRSGCRQEENDLTSVRDGTENAAVYSETSKDSWIGLYRHTWANWSDGTYSTFSNWDESMNYYLNTSANFHCAMVDTGTGAWSRASCYSQYPFICNTDQSAPGEPEIKRGYTKRFKLGLKTDANLNDATIQSQILQQIRAKLEERGISDFKLRWTQTDELSFDKEQGKKKRR